MVGNNLDINVLSTLARSAYAKSPSQPIFSVLISYFSGTLYVARMKVRAGGGNTCHHAIRAVQETWRVWSTVSRLFSFL